MVNFRKRVVTLALLCGLLLLAACQTPKGSAAPTPMPGGTPTAELSKEEAEFSYFKEGDTYRLYQWFQPDNGEPAFSGADVVSKHRRETITLLEEKYGITYEFIPQLPDYFTTVLSAAYSGVPMADGMHAGGPGNVLEDYYYNGLAGSVIMPISDCAVDFSNPDYFQQQVQNEFCTLDGKLQYFVMELPGIKAIEAAQVLFFNYRLLESLGGYQPSQIYDWCRSGEWTWERFMEVTVACTDADQGVYGFGRANALLNLINSNGGSIISTGTENGAITDTFTGNSAAVLSAYDFYKQLYNNNAMAPLDKAAYDSSAVTAFTSGQIVFMFNYFNRAMYNFGDSMQDKPFGYALIPKGPEASGYVSELNWFEPFCVFRGIANPNGVLKAMKELYRPITAKGSQENETLYQTEVADYVEDQNAFEILDITRSITLYKKTNIYGGVINAVTGNSAENDILTGAQSASAYLAGIENAMNEQIAAISKPPQ